MRPAVWCVAETPPAAHCSRRPRSRSRDAMARVLARAWPSSCIRFSSETPPAVHRSVGSRTSASVRPSRSNARHFTAPVLKSQPVTTRSSGTQRRGSVTGRLLSEDRGQRTEDRGMRHHLSFQASQHTTDLCPLSSVLCPLTKEYVMTGPEAIQSALRSSKAFMERLLADLSDADLLVRPVPGANHIAWQLGHLIAAESHLAQASLPDAKYPALPPGF